MGDNPALTFRQKPDSSIAVGFRHLTEGRIDGFASAGSTGAMMVGCMYTVKQIDGIIRPAISSVIPTIDGGSVMLLDVGLNVDCKPEVLYQYAVIGNLYAQGVLGKKRAPYRIAQHRRGKGERQPADQSRLRTDGRQRRLPLRRQHRSETHYSTGSVADVDRLRRFRRQHDSSSMSEGIFEMTRQQGFRKIPISNNLNYEKVGGTPVY